MKSTKEHKGSKPIRGDLTCFEKTQLEAISRSLLFGPLLIDSLIRLRNLGKMAFGIRMKMAAEYSNVYQKISEKSISILQEYIQENSVCEWKYVVCFLHAYNGESKFELNPPRCKTKVKKKAFSHGREDCIKAFNVYFKPVYDRIVEESKTALTDDSIVGKYEVIESSLKYILEYICTLNYEELPVVLDVHVYNIALMYDSNLSSYYEYDDIRKSYRRSNKSIFYSAISQECATYLICNEK